MLFRSGEDALTGQNYDHRKQWVVDRLAELSGVFAIDVCAYAVMSNHYHVVLRVDEAQAGTLTREAVVERWGRLFKLPVPIERYMKGEAESEAERLHAEQVIEEWRERLTNISWFMRGLNEPLARWANEEDQVTGRFWEGRFKSQALLDEVAVLSCMSYVDLNPVRAELAETPEASSYTSIQARIQSELANGVATPHLPVPLMPLVREAEDGHCQAIGVTLPEYLELVDWAGRSIREDKRGAISQGIPPILGRLGIDAGEYLQRMSGRSRAMEGLALGAVDRVKAFAGRFGRGFVRGQRQGGALYQAKQ